MYYTYTNISHIYFCSYIYICKVFITNFHTYTLFIILNLFHIYTFYLYNFNNFNNIFNKLNNFNNINHIIIILTHIHISINIFKNIYYIHKSIL